MKADHPKTVRRRLLEILYDRYMIDPLEMLSPEDVLAGGTVRRQDLMANMHYLSDRGLVELMIGYNPPMFAAVRISADGIDLVENAYAFNLRFPPAPGECEEAMAGVPVLMERLVEEADFSPLDGEARRCLLRDIEFLREELARPTERWRHEVLGAVLGWIGSHFDDPGEVLPSYPELKRILDKPEE